MPFGGILPHCSFLLFVCPRTPPTPPPGGLPTPPPGGRGGGGPPSWTLPPRRPAVPHPATQQPVGRRPRAAPLAVKLAFEPTPSSCAVRQNFGPSRFCSVRNDLNHCSAGAEFDGLALRRSRIWMYLIRACRRVLSMFVVGMRCKSGPSRNPFVCQCSPCAKPDRGHPIGGLHRHTDIQTDRYNVLLTKTGSATSSSES